jgi:hypothetical protein
VQDTIAPVIENSRIVLVNGENIVYLNYRSIFVDRTNVSDNYDKNPFRSATPGYNGIAEIDTRVRGRTEVTYYAKDQSGNESTLVIVYIVGDTVAPIINLNTADTVYHPVGTTYIPVKVTVTDNISKPSEITVRVQSGVNHFLLGLYQDIITATDADGNVAVKHRYVRVVDSIKPTIGGNPNDSICVGLESTLDLFDYVSVSDNYDGKSDLLKNLQLLSNDLNTYVEGRYTATFVVRDNSYNYSDTFELVIEVNKNCDKVSHVPKLAIDHFKMHPNPSTGQIVLTVSNPEFRPSKIELINSIGKLVLSVDGGSMQNGQILINLDEYAKGFYFIRLRSEKYNQTKKLILE